MIASANDLKASFYPRLTAMGVHVWLPLCVLYILTLMPGVPPTDSGELALAAWTGGVAHAPGFPTYTLIGWLWTHLLPVGRVIWRLNLLSALAGGAAAATIFFALRRIIRDFPKETSDHPSAISVIGASLGAFAFGLGRTVWNWSTVAEVYSLNLLFMAAILTLVIHADHPEPIAEAIRPRPGPPGRKGQRTRAGNAAKAQARGTLRGRSVPLILAAVLFGLGLGIHLTSLAVLAPGLAIWLSLRYGKRFWRSRLMIGCAVVLIAGATAYLYLPLRAATDPLLNWGQPDTLTRFWAHVTASQYRVSLFSAPVWPEVLLAARLWWLQFTPLGLLLVALGATFTWRHHRPLFWMVLLIIVTATCYAWAYIIEDDQDAYYLPAFLAAAFWLGCGVYALLHWLRRRSPTRWTTGAVLLALVVLSTALTMNWAAANRQNDTIPEDYVRDVFEELPAGSVLLTRDWQLYAPALYLQHVEHLRPDLTVIDTELLRRDWYFALLHRVDPVLMQAVGPEENAFRLLRDAWERGELAESDPRINDLQSAYVALLDAFTGQGRVAGRPVYAGPSRGVDELRNQTLQGLPDLEQGVGAAWRWLPAGLTFVAVRGDEPPPSIIALEWRSAAFGATTLLPPQRKIQATRADMATINGLYRANQGDLAGAEADWRLALHIDPRHAPAQELLRQLNAGSAP